MLVVGLFVFISACTDSESAESSVERGHGIPILASEVRGPGTRLPDGFHIPDGAVLAGPVLSEVERRGTAGQPTVVVRKWSAVLGIDGSPNRVVKAFADQAAHAGLVGERGPGCRAAFVPSPPPQPSQPAQCDFDTKRFAVTDAPPVGRVLSVKILQLSDGRTSGLIHLEDWTVDGQAAPSPTPGDPPTPSPDFVSLPTPPVPAPGHLARVGELIGFEIEPFVVEPGSELILPEVSYDTDPDGAAILRVTGSASSVFQAYLDQIGRKLATRTGKARLHQPSLARSDGWKIKTVQFDDRYPDGHSGTAQLFIRGRDAYVRIQLYAG